VSGSVHRTVQAGKPAEKPEAETFTACLSTRIWWMVDGLMSSGLNLRIKSPETHPLLRERARIHMSSHVQRQQGGGGGRSRGRSQEPATTGP
jgi:hypothetical protein